MTSCGMKREASWKSGAVFWYPDYAVRDEIEEIRRDLVLVFQGVE